MAEKQEKPKDYRIRLNREEMDFIVECVLFMRKSKEEPKPSNFKVEHSIVARLQRPGSARRW